MTSTGVFTVHRSREALLHTNHGKYILGVYRGPYCMQIAGGITGHVLVALPRPGGFTLQELQES